MYAYARSEQVPKAPTIQDGPEDIKTLKVIFDTCAEHEGMKLSNREKDLIYLSVKICKKLYLKQE